MSLSEIITITPLEAVAGFGYLIGHVLLSRRKISGWIVKIIGGTAWIVFLFQNENYIFMAVTVVIVLIMMYGFYKWTVGIFDKRTRIDLSFECLAAIVAIFMITRFLTSGVYELGPTLESAIVIAKVLGTVLLARKIILGWYAHIVMSLLAGILVIFVNSNPAVLLGILEVSSIYFYWRGIQSFSKSHEVTSV